MRVFNYFLLVSVLSFGFVPSVCAESEDKILILYKERDPDHKGIVDIFSGLLQEAGYTFDSRDIETVLTEKTDMSPYSGIMTTFQTSQMLGADVYPAWLVDQMEAGRPILIIGNYGAYQGLLERSDGSLVEWNESTETINTFFYPFGLRFYFAFTSDNKKLKLLKADKKYAQFESLLSQKHLNYYQLYKSINPNNRIFFELKRKDMQDSSSALNVITPFGGMILEGYSYFWDSRKNTNSFRVDFPSFMKEVFSIEPPRVSKLKLKSHKELIKAFPLPERAPPVLRTELEESEMPRRILMVYKKSEARSFKELPIYNRAAVILEYLGLIPVYRAVEDGLPSDDEMEYFHGIVSWHTQRQMSKAQAYGDWMLHQIEGGKRIAILEEYGASYDLDTQQPTTNQVDVMQALGIQYIHRDERREEYRPAVRLVDRNMLGFERSFSPSTISYQNTYHSKDPRNKVFFSFSDRDYGNVDLGVITPRGGISLEQSPFYFPHHDSKRIALVNDALAGDVAPEIAEQPTLGAWNLNPYRFFANSLGLDQLPTPDITTLNGSRIFYAHIDGDALESVSLIDGAHFAGFFIYQEILKKYPEIPTTVSVITQLIERNGNPYYRPAMELAREIYALPNVDIAVHTATHPFDWVGGDPYVINPDSYPYKIGYRSHDLIQEIWGAKLFVDHNLAPAGKKAATLFWSGATNPDKKALEIVWRSGMHNLNGGDPRLDDANPSLANLAPYSLPYSPYRQYLTSAQNDYYYTLFLTGDWGGQKQLLQHFDKTDKPYRIYPMNLYYHFYSGIKNESMDALKTVYDYIRSLDATSIFTTQYLEIVEDYYRTRIGLTDDGYWVENDGFLRTMRLNGRQHVDMKRSRGVLGYSHSENNQTYVHLDSQRRRKIVLADIKPKSPYLIQATQFIDELTAIDGQVHFICRGFGKTLLKFGGLHPDTDYRLTLTAKSETPVTVSIKTDQEGILEFRTQLDAPQNIYTGTLEVL